MHPHTSAVREVLQWVAELHRIQEARQVELGEAQENRLQQYREAATALGQADGSAVGGALAQVAALDRERCRQRLQKDKTLENWTRFLKDQAACKGKGGFDAAAKLVAQASQLADDPLQQQELLAQARQKLWEDTPVGLKKDGIPGVPSGQSPRAVDPEKAAAALKRKDLRKHIARNDTWGNFDPAKALGKDASEADLKVLLNIIESAMEADAQDQAWSAYEKAVTEAIKKRGHPPSEPVKVYKEVILGAGASAAYYIASNFGSFDMPATMILGDLQPWAGERGKSGNINHPHHQVDPQHKRKPIEDKEEGLASREEFSRRIAEVIAKVPHTPCTIHKVSRCPGDFFEIATSRGVFYANKVTNAMGIGQQKEPGTIEPAARPHTKDMDAFKSGLDGDKSFHEAFGKIKSVCVSGGNAAIDVITAILRNQGKKPEEKLQVHWIVGESGPPAFLNGTDNALASKAYPDGDLATGPITKDGMTVYKGYLDAVSGAGPVTVNYSCGGIKQKPFPVDMVIYGTGPDVARMQALFVDETKKRTPKDEPPLELEPVIDKDRHYNMQIEEKDPDELLKKLEGKLKDKDQLLGFLKDPSLKGVADNLADVIVSVKSKDDGNATSTMQFVGASGARLKTAASTAVPLASPKHETMATLPENVVGNDQLTSSRSRIEAQFNALPMNLEEDVPLVTLEGGVNFITSNQTVIRVHIAECYPKIPAGLGDYVTGQIIFERSRRTPKDDTPKTPIPSEKPGDTYLEHMSLERQKDFQKKWTKRLRDISASMA